MNLDASVPAVVDEDNDGEAVSVAYVDGEPRQQTVVALTAIQGILSDYQPRPSVKHSQRQRNGGAAGNSEYFTVTVG